MIFSLTKIAPTSLVAEILKIRIKSAGDGTIKRIETHEGVPVEKHSGANDTMNRNYASRWDVRSGKSLVSVLNSNESCGEEALMAQRSSVKAGTSLIT